MSPTPPAQPPRLPKRPERRPAPRRAHSLLFWTVFAVFVAAICYLGLLAFGGEIMHPLSGTVTDTHRLDECLVAIGVVAALAAGICTLNPRR
jgi:hypothetical protein